MTEILTISEKEIKREMNLVFRIHRISAIMAAFFCLKLKGILMQNPKDDVLYAPVEWVDHSEGYSDIRYHKSTDGIAKITINRPEVRNAFRPQTVKEMINALSDARFDEKIGVIVLTGEGEKAFCSGGDQKIRGDYGGYKDESGVHHLNVLDFQRGLRYRRRPRITHALRFNHCGRQRDFRSNRSESGLI